MTGTGWMVAEMGVIIYEKDQTPMSHEILRLKAANS